MDYSHGEALQGGVNHPADHHPNGSDKIASRTVQEFAPRIRGLRHPTQNDRHQEQAKSPIPQIHNVCPPRSESFSPPTPRGWHKSTRTAPRTQTTGVEASENSRCYLPSSACPWQKTHPYPVLLGSPERPTNAS